MKMIPLVFTDNWLSVAGEKRLQTRNYIYRNIGTEISVYFTILVSCIAC